MGIIGASRVVAFLICIDRRLFVCQLKSIYPNLAIIRGTNTVAKDLPECSALLCITQKTMEIDHNKKCV